MRHPNRLKAFLLASSLAASQASYSQSVFDFGAAEDAIAQYRAGSVLDLDAPSTATKPKAEVVRKQEPTARQSQAQAFRNPVGRPQVEALILDVGMHYAGHKALRKVGLTAKDWVAFFRANIAIESAFRTTARSHVGAIGLGQLMPETAKALGVNPYDPRENLHGSARYLLTQLERFGSKELALAAYNAGPEAVAKYSGIPPFRETQGHVRKVMKIFRNTTGDSA